MEHALHIAYKLCTGAPGWSHNAANMQPDNVGIGSLPFRPIPNHPKKDVFKEIEPSNDRNIAQLHGGGSASQKKKAKFAVNEAIQRLVNDTFGRGIATLQRVMTYALTVWRINFGTSNIKCHTIIAEHFLLQHA